VRVEHRWRESCVRSHVNEPCRTETWQVFCVTGSGLWYKLSEACAYVCP
jgi:hypothetical protein